MTDVFLAVMDTPCTLADTQTEMIERSVVVVVVVVVVDDDNDDDVVVLTSPSIPEGKVRLPSYLGNHNSSAIPFPTMQCSVCSISWRLKMVYDCHKCLRHLTCSELLMYVISRRVCTNTVSCLLYTSPSPRDISGSRMPSSA